MHADVKYLWYKTVVGIASIVVAVVAALISGWALLYTRRADQRAQKNEERLTAQ
jgi:hypothetical protein